jgi:outer membrane protein insertion porin family
LHGLCLTLACSLGGGTARAQPEAPTAVGPGKPRKVEAPVKEAIEEAKPEPEPSPVEPQRPDAPPTAIERARDAVGAPRLSRWTFSGSLIDPVEKLQALVDVVAPAGGYFIESGDLDVGGTPVGTAPRIAQALHAIGYHALVQPVPGAGGVALVIDLHPYDRIRHIFVRGNWPLRQDEIWRRLSLRPGTPLPMPGTQRDALFAEETSRIQTFLRDQGYLEAKVYLEPESRGGIPAAISLLVKLDLGPGYPIGAIKVTGAQAVPGEEIAEGFRHFDWRFLWLRHLPFRLDRLREDSASLVGLYKGLGFPAARVLPRYDLKLAAQAPGKSVPLTLEVFERKKLEFAFLGNDCCTGADLRGELTFDEEGTYDDTEVARSRDALARFYRERGHMLVNVEAERQRVSSKVDRVVFRIDEGPRLKVRDVSFEGAQTISEGVLAGSVTVKTYPLWGLGSGGYTSLRQLESDVDRIEGLYAGRGYTDTTADVQIAPVEGDFRALSVVESGADRAEWERSKGVRVRFTVREGIQRYVGSIDFATTDGQPLPRDTAFLRASLLTRTASPFRPGIVREDGRRLRRVLGDEGYPYASVEPVIDEKPGTVHLTWLLTLGPRVKVGPVFVRGNFHTHESTILRWISLRTGSYLTTTQVERGERNLALMQYFTNANPIRFPGHDEGLSSVPMLVSVEERHDHFGVVRFGTGISTDQAAPDGTFPLGGFLSTGYEHGNLLGRGYLFRARGSFGNTLTRMEAAFEDPRFMGTILRLQLTGLYFAQETAALGDLRSGTGTIGFARELVPGLDAYVNYGLSDVSRTEFFVRASGADFAQQTVRIGTYVGSFTAGLEILRLDNLLVPRQGLKASTAIELATPALSFGLGGDTFIKLLGQVLVVVPLSPRLSLRLALRYDQGIPLDGATFIPKVERFFAGGDTTIRGYQLDRARTEVRVYGLTPDLNLVQFAPLGGNLRVLSNLELQLQVAGPLWAAVFLDTGAVEDSLEALRPERFRQGAGFSPLLVKLPIGDISFSWAWPLNPGPGDSRYGRFHFNVGLMF